MFKKLLLLSLVLTVAACTTVKEEKQVVIPQGDTHWTLEFTWLYRDRPTHKQTFQYESRHDCFDAMYQMQKEASKKRFHAGAGLCTKLFADGQERTHNDVLGKR